MIAFVAVGCHSHSFEVLASFLSDAAAPQPIPTWPRLPSRQTLGSLGSDTEYSAFDRLANARPSQSARHSAQPASPPWLFFALFAGAFYFGGVPDLNLSAPSAPSAVNPVSAATDTPRHVTKKIRDIRIFD